MEYVINPMWFYWFQACDSLRIFLVLISVVGCGICIMFTCFEADNDDIDDNQLKARIRKIVALSVIGVTIGLLIPTQETLIKMQIAKWGTTDNVETVLNTIDEKTDALIDAIGGKDNDEK